MTFCIFLFYSPYTKQLIKFVNMLVYTFYLSRLVRYTNSYHTTIGIGKCYDRYCLCFRFYLNAFAIKCLIFLAGLYFLYGLLSIFTY